MATQTKITADLGVFNAFLSSLKSDKVVRVGILGGDAYAPHEGSEEGLTNAAIGVIQEFGSEKNNIPPRSFLRMPIERKSKEIMRQASKGSTKAKIAAGDIDGALENIGVIAEGIVQDAFSSSGFGQWPENAPSTVAAKGSSKPLIDTGQLRRSITSDVVKRSEI